MKTFTFLMLLLMVALGDVAGQDRGEYPLPVSGGGNFQVPAGQRFWVLKDDQYKAALQFAKNDSLAAAMESVLNEKIKLLTMMVAHKDSTIGFYREGYNHYTNLWEKTDQELEVAEVKASQRFSYFNVGFWMGVIVAGTIAIAAN